MNISALLNNNKTQSYTVTSPYGNRMIFTFRYTYVGSSWRAYIIGCPSYGSRTTDLHYTHRYYDSGCGLYYVCWTRDLTRIEDMMEISRVWAIETSKYIDTGERF